MRRATQGLDPPTVQKLDELAEILSRFWGNATPGTLPSTPATEAASRGHHATPPVELIRCLPLTEGSLHDEQVEIKLTCLQRDGLISVAPSRNLGVNSS
jgi:hypothetical protein